MTDENDADGPDLPLGTGPVQASVLALRFLTELALLAALAVVGAKASGPVGVRIAMAIGGPVVAAIIWGLVVARQARRRLSDPWRLVAEIVLFGIVTIGFVLESAFIAAMVFCVLTVGIAIIARFVAPEG